MTQKGTPFIWTAGCGETYTTLKDHLKNASIQAHSCFDNKAVEFRVHIDASAVGVGVMLEQDDHVIAYTS